MEHKIQVKTYEYECGEGCCSETKIREAKERKLERQLEESSSRVEQALTHIKKPYTKLEIMDMWLSGNFNAELLMHHALLELAKK